MSKESMETIKLHYENKLTKNIRPTVSLCTGMEILAWFFVGGKYYLHTGFLYTTGLLRYQGPPEK